MYFEPWLVTVLLESHASKLIFRESWEVLMDFLIFRVHSGYLKPRSRDQIWLVNWKWNGSWNFQRLVALSHLVEPLLLHMKPSSDISENILLQLHFTIHLMVSPSHNRDLITTVLYQNEQPSNPFLMQLWIFTTFITSHIISIPLIKELSIVYNYFCDLEAFITNKLFLLFYKIVSIPFRLFQVWFKNKRAKYRQLKKQQQEMHNKPDQVKVKPCSSLPPPGDQAISPEPNKASKNLNFRGVAIPQNDVTEFLKHSSLLKQNVEKQEGYRPFKPVDNAVEDHLMDLANYVHKKCMTT